MTTIIHNRCSRRSEEESPAPAMTLSLSHSQHVQTQKGLATQGRGLDNEDLPCFESEKVTTYEKRSQHVPSSYTNFSTSFANPSNALKVHQFSTNPNSSCHVFTSCSGLEMLEEKSQTQASGDIGPITRRAAGHFCPRTSLGLLTSREISGTLKDLWKWQRVHSKLRLGNVGLGERRRRPERRVWDDGPFLKGTSLAHGENFGSRSCRKRQLRRHQNPRL